MSFRTDYCTLPKNGNIFGTPILQSFLVKTNLSINLHNLVNFLPIVTSFVQDDEHKFYKNAQEQSTTRHWWDNDAKSLPELSRSGTIIALKYKNTIKGNDSLFKTKNGFKNACHLIMCHTLDKRKKKLVHIKITAVGTFQVVGIPAVDVEKVIFKLFLLLEKINKKCDIFTYVSATKTVEHNRLEIVIVPILNNYMLTLDPKTTEKIFQNSKVHIAQKFIDNNFLSFMVPNDPAITIKKSFTYEDFSNHPIKYITWNKKRGKTIYYIEYNSYTTLLKDAQKENSMAKKYITLRLYSTGKVLVSGFDKILIQQGVEQFLSICDTF